MLLCPHQMDVFSPTEYIDVLEFMLFLHDVSSLQPFSKVFLKMCSLNIFIKLLNIPQLLKHINLF